MEEQTAFCPSCGAPQIRVSVRTEPQEQDEPEFLNTPPPPPLIGSESQPFPITMGFSPSRHILWKNFTHIILPMAVLVGASSVAIPLLSLLVLLPASVVLGIHLYRRRQQLGPIRASLGARLGAFTGLLSFGFFLIVFAVAATSHQAEYREIIAKALQDATASNPDPQIQQMMHFLFSGTAGMLFLTVVVLGFMMIFFLIISSVTGALAATVSGDKKTL